ncbi:MAG TPA: four helix bundle protein [Planctomycetaceae bacterium]|nr:four helix bundle protein [Planctomycetaceae bacterium]
MRDHRNLRAFQLADELALLVYRETNGFPKEEMFGLTSQVRRAAVSVASNIAEGCGRSTDADFLRFLDMANGSLRELQYQISLANRLGYLPTGTVLADDTSVLFETGRVLHGLIRSMRANSVREEAISYSQANSIEE